MYTEGVNRINDGEFLSSKREGDSGYLLYLLGFELMLKCTLLLEQKIELKNHKYYGMYCSLNRELKKKIISKSQEISQIFNINERVQKLLETFEYNFIRLRYPYQSYENMNESEYKEYSILYAELGFPEGEAEFEYYPEELRGITMALREHIESKIC